MTGMTAKVVAAKIVLGIDSVSNRMYLFRGLDCRAEQMYVAPGKFCSANCLVPVPVI